MDAYLDIANGGLLFFLCAAVLAFVAFQAVIFIKKAWKFGTDLSFPKETMVKVMRNSAIFSILPSLPILVYLLIMMPTMGKWIPWLRLSVIGSGGYENLAANTMAQAFGLTSYTEGMTLEILICCLIGMTIGIMWGPLCTALGSKYIQKGMQFIKAKNEKMFKHIFSAMFVAMLCIFSASYFGKAFRAGSTGVTGLIPVMVLVTAMLFTQFLNIFAKKIKSRVLSEFSFPLSLVVGMLSAIAYNAMLA